MKLEKRTMIDILRKSLGIYSTGFIVVSDAMAYVVKRTLIIIHDFIPLVLLHRGVDYLQTAKNNIGKNLSNYAYCPRCAGNGVVFEKSKTDNKMRRNVCPICKGSGKYNIDLSMGRCNDDLCLTKDAAADMAVDTNHVEELIRQAKQELENQLASCGVCGGSGRLSSSEPRDESAGDKQCEACYGTGKNYLPIATELMQKCIAEMVEIGFAEEAALLKCPSTYPKESDKAHILKQIQNR
jgi:hypothetical protein